MLITTGLLSNHDYMTVERIFSMLKLLFVGTGNDIMNKLDMNIVSLRKQLILMVESEKIDFMDNKYMARKK